MAIAFAAYDMAHRPEKENLKSEVPKASKPSGLEAELTPDPAALDPSDEKHLSETERLIARYQEQGEVGALDELFGRYFERVRRKVRVMMSPSLLGRVEPEDIVNSTFGQAFELIDRFEYREPASVINWLSAIALNKIRDRFKYFNRRAEQELEGLFWEAGHSSIAFQPPDPRTLPPERVAQEEIKSKVDNCVAQLKPDYRTVILLRDYEGGSWKYVGGRMQRSDKAAHMLHSKAKLALLKVMKQEGIV